MIRNSREISTDRKEKNKMEKGSVGKETMEKESIGKETMEKDEKVQKNAASGKKIAMKQAAAILAIVLLVLMYVISLILAIFDNTASGVMFRASLVGTFAIPLLAWVYIWMYGKLTRKHTMADFEMDQKAGDTVPEKPEDADSGK